VPSQSGEDISLMLGKRTSGRNCNLHGTPRLAHPRLKFLQPSELVRTIASLPPVSSLFAAVLGVNPVQHLLSTAGVLSTLPQSSRQILTGRAFFPQLISVPFHQGLVIALSVSACLAAVAGVASLLRGGRYVHSDSPAGGTGDDSDQAPGPAAATVEIATEPSS
jgi:hypothetical protein